MTPPRHPAVPSRSASAIRWWALEWLDRILRRVWPFNALRAALWRHRLERMAPQVAFMNDWINAADQRRALWGHPSLREEADAILARMAVNAAGRKAGPL